MRLLGRSISPFRRTPGGLLSYDRLDAYTEYLRLKETGQIPDNTIMERLTPKIFTSCQYAMVNRLGFSTELSKDDSNWISSFYPKNYALDYSEDNYWLGKKILSYFSQEHVSARFPQASGALRGKLVNIHSGTLGMNGMARQHGIDKCIANILGWHMEPLSPDLKSLNERTRQMVFPRERVNLKLPRDDAEAITWTMVSMVGAMWKSFGGKSVKRFLDARLFSASLSLNDILFSASPLMELSELLLQLHGPLAKPKFKLLAESGRLSKDSMYIVGVFLDNEKLGEGFGQSILIAQKRSCVDALRKIYFKEEKNYRTPSALFMHDQQFADQMGISC